MFASVIQPTSYNPFYVNQTLIIEKDLRNEEFKPDPQTPTRRITHEKVSVSLSKSLTPL